MPLAPLPSSTIRLIGSSQVITSVSSVIKELMENSIDSGAQHIEIKLDKHGLEKIEVKDDGCGIEKNDATVMCLPNYTSKISDFSDLDSLSSYGFRGEALSSLCNVAQVSVTTKTAGDDIATCYTYDHNGQITCSKISHILKGTIITVTELFKNLPVRKQFVSSSKRAAEELKRVEKVVKSLAMVHPRLRVTLIHNKFLIWQKTSVANLRQSVMQVVSLNIVKQLHHILHNSEQIRVEMLVPKRDCDISSLCFSNFSDAYFLFVNNRPVRNKEVEKAVYNKLFDYFGVYVPANKYPVCIMSITLSPDGLDVNLEPNKTRVYLKNQDEVLDFLKQCMHVYYGEGKKEEEEHVSCGKPNKKRKVGDECPSNTKKANLEENSNCENILLIETNSQLSDHSLTVVENNNQLENHSSGSETVINSDQSSSQHESSASKQDMDCIFEDFCLERENELSDSIKNGSNNEVEHIQTSTNSENLSNDICSKFFTPFSGEYSLNESRSTDTYLNNFINRSNTSQQIDSLVKVKENKDTSLKKMVDCLKKVSENSVTVQKIQKLDSYFLKPGVLGDESGGVEDKSHPLDHESQPLQDESPHLKSESPPLDFRLNESPPMENESPPMEIESPLMENEFPPALFIGKKNCHSNTERNIDVDEQKTSIHRMEECSIGISSPTLSQWSKGEVINSAGSPVQGSYLLTKNQELGSPSASQELTNRSVSSQMGCKEMSAFTKFARKMRKEILDEKPDLSFTRVAQLLQVQWRHLDVEEKKKYEEVVKVKRSPSCTKQKPISAFFSKSPNIELQVSLDRIKQIVNKPMQEDEHEVCLIGQVEASPLWYYLRRGYGIYIVSTTRLLEAVRFHKHLANFALPVKLLNDIITITPSNMGETDWDILLNLERSLNGVIKDSRFVSNGFFIEIMEGEKEAHITYVPQNISYCGLEEVLEILSMLQTNGLEVPLAHCRPLKVISFIRSEVMRECSQEDPPSQPEQVSELLSYWLKYSEVMRECSQEDPPSQPEQVSELLSYWLNYVTSDSQSCIHYHPVSQCLYSL